MHQKCKSVLFKGILTAYSIVFLNFDYMRMRYTPAAFKIHKLQLVIKAFKAKVGDYAAKEKERILIF